MAQLSYPVDQPVAFPGLLADLNDSNYIVSRANEAAAAMEYGIAVIEGTADDQMLRVTDAAQPIAGVTVHQHANEVGGDDLNLIDPNKMGDVLRRGTIYVQVEDAVSKGDAPFVRVLVGGGGIIGAFRSDADGGNARQLSNARYATSADASGFAVLEFTELSALL
jgi:phage tail sheath protein FI